MCVFVVVVKTEKGVRLETHWMGAKWGTICKRSLNSI